MNEQKESSHHKKVSIIEFEVNDFYEFAKPILSSSKKYRTLSIIYEDNH